MAISAEILQRCELPRSQPHVFIQQINLIILKSQVSKKRNEEKIRKVFRGVLKLMKQSFVKINNLGDACSNKTSKAFIEAYFLNIPSQDQPNNTHPRQPRHDTREELVSLVAVMNTFTRKNAIDLLQINPFLEDFEQVLVSMYIRQTFLERHSLIDKIIERSSKNSPHSNRRGSLTRHIPWSRGELVAAVEICLNLCRQQRF